MRFYIPLLALMAACLLPPTLAHAGAVFELETTNHSSGSATTEETKMSIEGPNVMVDMGRTARKSGGAPDQFIFRGDRGEMIVIDHAGKSYMVMDKESLKAMSRMMGAATGAAGNDAAEDGEAAAGMEAMIQEALKNVPEEKRAEVERALRGQMGGKQPGTQKNAAPTVEYRKTKDHSKQAGYPCVKFEAIQDGQKVREMWVTDWGKIEGGEEARDAFKAMAKFWEEAFGSLARMEGENPIDVFEKVDGFPVVMREFSGGEVESESVLKSAKQQDLDPATFDPPKGYKLNKMGGE